MLTSKAFLSKINEIYFWGFDCYTLCVTSFHPRRCETIYSGDDTGGATSLGEIT
jgi:hypothetical protein